MEWISENFLKDNINYTELIEALKSAFRKNSIQCPPKSSYTYTGVKQAEDNTFLIMPAWDNQKVFGTKLITATSNNPKLKLPYIQGIYILFNAENGKPIFGIDAKSMTNYRTAASSALAASYLAIKEASSILFIGCGSLAPYFIRAHASVRNYDKMYIWSRSIERSGSLVKEFEEEGISIISIDDYKKVSKDVDVISCITSSKTPIVQQSDLGHGQHLDLAGSFTRDMHEVSTDVILNTTVYTDNLDRTPDHAGELFKAISEGVFSAESIEGDLVHLCKDNTSKRKNNEENTLFKSTGMALEDLVIAQLIYKKHEQTRE